MFEEEERVQTVERSSSQNVPGDNAHRPNKKRMAYVHMSVILSILLEHLCK